MKIMKFKYQIGAFCAAVLLAVSGIPAQAGEVASSEEMTEVQQVLEEGMSPVTGADIRDGVYDVEVNSSSSMFRIVEAKLTVEDGEMSAVLTLSGTGYLMLYMGTGEDAVAAEETEYISYVENADGAYTYQIPVSALDAEIDCAAYSKRKEKWYDRKLVFRADSLPEGAILTRPADTDLEDGDYEIEVSLAGGSGRASIESPAKLSVQDGKATARIVWSSSNYDYMKLGSQVYYPVQTEGNSTFEIPVTVFDGEMAVTADTTAMSTPHEIAYTLHFDSSSVRAGKVNLWIPIGVAVGVCLVIVAVYIGFKRRKSS
jgi:hypothetical protein